MKRLLLVLPFLGMTLFSSGQVVTNCQATFVDTLHFIEQVKTSTLLGISVNTNNDGAAPGYGYAGFAQRFEAPDSVKVLGFSFGGWIFSGAADTVVCRLYKDDGSGMPGVQIDSVIYTVPLVAGFTSPLTSNAIKNEILFGSGYIIEGDYIVTVENFSTSDLYLVRSTAGDGLNEGLCLLYYRGLTDPTYDGWYSAASFGATWDFDMNFKPIIEYTVNSTLTLSSDTICSGDTLLVSSSASFDDSIFYNRMYNPNFATYNGFTTNPFYNYGDGVTDGTGSHVFATNGNNTVTLMDSITTTGWTINQFDFSCSDMVNINGASLGPDTMVCMQSTMVLYPGVFDSYSWNSGQTTDSITVGPILNPGVITYTVNVTSSTCNSSASITITFDNCVGIEEETLYTITAFPNPASSTITVESDFKDATELKIYDNQGKVVLSKKMTKSQQQLDVSALDQGNYILIIANENQVIRKKVQILR